MSSWVASKMAASSATRGWNSCDLLLRVDGRGVGSGNTGNTETIRICVWMWIEINYVPSNNNAVSIGRY